MCDCVSTTLLPHFVTRSRKLGFTKCVRTPEAFCRHIRRFDSTAKSTISAKVSRNSSDLESGELRFQEKAKSIADFEELGDRIDNSNEEIVTNLADRTSDAPASSSVDFLEFKENGGIGIGIENEEDLVEIGKFDDGNEKPLSRSSRQLMKRTNLMAKQVISVHSALSLGFVSQLWVDINSWMVLVVEVRPNLLSGELERFLLEDVSLVGDVVLIQDESVMENELKMFGLETLVGYNVVTPSRRYIGKVRGFTFNINSGTVESLELDAFGISIIPSSLVSTYALFVEDVMEVLGDTVVVHEAGAKHIQRITKGFWDTMNLGEEYRDYYDTEKPRPVRRKYGRNRQRRRKSRSKKRDTDDDDDDDDFL